MKPKFVGASLEGFSRGVETFSLQVLSSYVCEFRLLFQSPTKATQYLRTDEMALYESSNVHGHFPCCSIPFAPRTARWRNTALNCIHPGHIYQPLLSPRKPIDSIRHLPGSGTEPRFSICPAAGVSGVPLSN